MQFSFKKRAANFGVYNNRLENNGPDKKVKAIDLPFEFQMKPKEIDMVVPTNGVPLSQFLFGDNLRKPELQTHLLSPLKVQRKPEHIELVIYDDGIDKRKCMRFKDTTVKDPTIVIDQDGTPYLTGKFQIHPNGQLQRISDNIEGQTREFECRATQPELFDEKEEEEDEPAGEQQDFMDSPDKGDKDEDDDED
ncbi:MAG TPA: hypothetical protein VLH80_07555 [Nitrospiraceae bacterium]|nr:hypothetical protein [Nitrospiraceae bacterium]